MNWRDKSKNYLTGVHRGWAAWSPTDQTVPISYDDKHIWVSRADGRQVRRDLWAHVKAIASWVSRADRKQVRLTGVPRGTSSPTMTAAGAPIGRRPINRLSQFAGANCGFHTPPTRTAAERRPTEGFVTLCRSRMRLSYLGKLEMSY